MDFLAFNVFSSLGYKLRSRIVWTFNFGLHGSRRFSGRYEVLLWFTKNDDYKFNLDPVRVPQKYPGKRHSSKKAAERAGKLSGNPLGKNPGDFWEFDASAALFDKPIWRLPNVKANHPEKTAHPCQFPVEVAERCILALTSEGDSILDPFAGVGSSMLAAEKHSRIGIGIEKEASYQKLAMDRLEQLRAGTLPLRPSGKPVAEPDGRAKVATYPLEWMNAEGKG